MRVSTSVIIERPIREVFSFVATPSLRAHWIAGVSTVEKTSGRPLDVGSAFEQTERALGRLRRSSWEVIEYEPPHVWSCRRLTEPSRIVRQVFESVEDSTRLTLCTEDGPLTSGLEVERAIRAQQERDLERLKRLLEWVDDPGSEASVWGNDVPDGGTAGGDTRRDEVERCP